LLAKGRRIQVIAQMLEIAPVTVEMHLRNARSKLNASTTPQAVAIAIRKGVISGS
jgi:DNA-binding CsgD family transcriptional regulator